MNGSKEYKCGVIEKYDDYAILIFPNRKPKFNNPNKNFKSVKCIIDIVDIKKLKDAFKDEKADISIEHIYRNPHHQIHFRFGSHNTQSDYSIFQILIDKDAATRFDPPIEQNEEYILFDLRPKLRMLRKSREANN